MIKGFRDFIMRGNVLDLAIAVVIGTAFTAIVTKFTENIVNPMIAALGGSGDVSGLGFSLRTDTQKLAEATFIDIGAVITAMINFLLVAAVVYFLLVVPMNKMAERRKGNAADEPAPVAEDVALLTEIRDLLRTQSRA